jgi:prolyl-tRNA synthetase
MAKKSHRVRELAEQLYEQLAPPVWTCCLMIAPAPRRDVRRCRTDRHSAPMVIGDRGLDNGIVEYRRRGGQASEIAIDQVVSTLTSSLQRI